ncbi:MAG: hypothetical protein IH878_16870 [Gemmatimonadetes bacterium]|nr:hypothetical protein [Gemmatimonadota bacterium]
MTIVGNEIRLEPVHNVSDPYARLETEMPGLLAEMRRDLRGNPLKREIVLLERSWTYWAKGNELFYFFDDHPDLLSKLQILSNHGLVTEITHNNVTRYLMTENLAQYLAT